MSSTAHAAMTAPNAMTGTPYSRAVLQGAFSGVLKGYDAIHFNFRQDRTVLNPDSL